MNEKIKLLAEQADKWAGTEFHRLFLNNINASMKELFEEKFAELIVRECVDNVKVWEKDSRNHISYMLKRHFGVKE